MDSTKNQRLLNCGARLAAFKPIALGCHKDNIRAAKFYMNHGFKRTGVYEGNDEEYFESLFEKYGDDFNWMMIPFSEHTFSEELKRELGNNTPKETIYSIAKCESKDDVLFLIGEIYRIYHLTYSQTNTDGFPRYIEFGELSSVMEYIEKEYLEMYR